MRGVVVYVVIDAWDMHALRDFIKRRPMIGASLQIFLFVYLLFWVVEL